MNGAILIISCLACVSLGQALDINLVAANFGRVISEVQVEKLEPYVEYGDYFAKFAKLNEMLINDLTIELFRQARLQSNMLMNAVNSLKSKLDHEIGILDSYRPHNMDSHLANLNERLRIFLEFHPGNVPIEHQPLPDIPERTMEIQNFVRYHSLEKLFLNVGEILDTHMSNIDALLHRLYTTGWEGARTSYNQIQDQFRHEFLNGSILRTFGTVVTDLLQKKLHIQPIVTPETWTTFEDLGLRIKTIFDEINTSNNRTTT